MEMEIFHAERHGRGGSRTPRPRARGRAASPEACEKGDLVRFTPNGTKVPEGPPPRDEPMLPPIPPFPTAAGEPLVEGTSFVSNLYDACESKPHVKNGDKLWKPQSGQNAGDEVMTASEAKQAWLEREVQSLKTALNRVSVPDVFRQSGYWNGSFAGKTGLHASDVSHAAAANRLSGDERALHGGSGKGSAQARAQQLFGDLPGLDRACPAHGGLHEGDRAQQVLGGLPGGDRAQQVLGGLHGGDRAQHAHGGLCDGDRAMHGDPLQHGRALRGGDAVLPGLQDPLQHGRALHGGDAVLPGRQDLLHEGLPHGGVQGHGTMGVAPMPASWEASGGGGGGKAELPMLPNGASPLEFGDWLCLCGPIMKDLSHVAGRWWDATVRQAYAFYMEWKGLSPLQRVQLCPRLPDELMASGFIRTEQRGVTLLLKAVSEEQQKELVVDRDLTSTAILFRLHVRHQPGGPGEKAILLGQLTSLQKASSMQELASSLRTWRRYFARAREVDASLPDGVLLIKALEAAVVQIAKEDSQAAFRLSTSRQQLALDQRPTEQTIWSFSQCLLAEAETLSLLKSSSTTTTNVSTPVRLKQMDAEASNSPQKPGTPGNYGNKSGKGHSTPMSEQTCKFFRSDTGCKAGRSCKWSQSWEGIEDKNSRCWICGGKDHRKTECKVKGNGNNKPSSYDSGLGGGRGGGNQNAANNKAAVKQASVGKVMMV